MAEVLIYERPVPLNREDHKNLRIKPTNNVTFAAHVHSVPLTIGEFSVATRDYPILFGGNSLEEAGPLAMLGLTEQQNLFIDADGQWERGAYVPAFVRRYPFVLAEKPPEVEGDDFMVYLDDAYPGFSTEEGDRLFNDDGTDTATLKGAVEFLSQFQEQVVQTRRFTARLRELDLLEPRSAQIHDEKGATVASIGGLFLVNEDKLRQLDEKTAHELLADGSLGAIFAHLLSLANMDRLQARLERRRAAAQPTAANA